jgi:hypothetical protein
VEECGSCPVFASFTLAFALQLRKKDGKNCQGNKNLSQVNKNSVSVQYYQKTHTYTHTHTHITKQYKTTTVQIKTNTVHNNGIVDIMVVQGRKLLKAWTRQISTKKSYILSH